MTIENTHCCGMDLLEDHHEWEECRDTVFEVCDHYYQSGRNHHTDDESIVPFLILSASSYQWKDMEKFRRYVTTHKLGRIISSRSKHNPNSGNNLKAYIWETNHNNLQKFYKQRPKEYKSWQDGSL